MSTIKETEIHIHECKCLSWKPIIAGALVAVGLSFILNLFSVAIGLTAFTAESNGAETLAIGGLIGTSIGIIVSMFVAGWIAGYLGSRYCVKRHLGSLYGFLTWCLALIIGILLASHAQDYITFYTHSLSGTTHVVAQAQGVTNTSAAISTPTENVVISTYILFCLFFLSALACCLGGHAGMLYVNKDEKIGD